MGVAAGATGVGAGAVTTGAGVGMGMETLPAAYGSVGVTRVMIGIGLG